MKKLLLVMVCSAVTLVFAQERAGAPAAATAPTAATTNPVTIVKGKVNLLQSTGSKTFAVIVDLPPAEGKAWGERTQVPWGTNFHKNGAVMKSVTNIVMGEDIAIVKNGAVTTVYLGEDAKNIGANGQPAAAQAYKFKPMEKPKSLAEIKSGIRSRDDARKALRQNAITSEEYLKMIKDLPGN